jgi:pyruvate-ferredoxin/flavodoxin oxidoreductase
MHARSTGWAMLSAGSVQEAHDFALVAHAATLRFRVPFLHFFDGFRTSHELNKIWLLSDSDIVLMAGDGDCLPVSALPVEGTFPTGTAAYEKRAIAKAIPIWDPAVCVDCGKCAIVCPHATIRVKVFGADLAAAAPEGFLSKPFRSKDLDGHYLTIQVAPDDCTGCGVCVDVCPGQEQDRDRSQAINMEPAPIHRDEERRRWDHFLTIPQLDRDLLPHDSVKGSQVLEPLVEFSGARAGCGETPTSSW